MTAVVKKRALAASDKFILLGFGNSESTHVPEGHLTIAQRFERWVRSIEYHLVPKGRPKSLRTQPSLRDSNVRRRDPGVETPGYSRMSLRAKRYATTHYFAERRS
jgi:hypothetical protein